MSRLNRLLALLTLVGLSWLAAHSRAESVEVSESPTRLAALRVAIPLSEFLNFQSAVVVDDERSAAGQPVTIGSRGFSSEEELVQHIRTALKAKDATQCVVYRFHSKVRVPDLNEYQPGLLKWCEENDVDFITTGAIGLDRPSRFLHVLSTKSQFRRN